MPIAFRSCDGHNSPSSMPMSFVFSSSRQDFVTAYVDYVFNISVATLFECFYAGFHKVWGGKVLELFQPNELQAMVIGNTNYDWTELEKVFTHGNTSNRYFYTEIFRKTL